MILDRLRGRPRLRKADVWLTLLPALYWLAAIQLRAVVIRPYCEAAPARCAAERVPAIDRPGLGLESGPADGFSLFTQNLSGILALSVPALWNFSLGVGGALSPAAALMATATDWVLTTQTATWNGALTETARLIAQRPRPFVYTDHSRAADPQNYTSFYSGHTSFSSAACFSMLFALLGQGAPSWLLILAGLASQCLIFSTGLFRILSGRHFLSDVLTASIMGTLVALAVAYKHRLYNISGTPR